VKRRHLFEFNDEPWAPEVLRESIVETLGRAIRWSGMLRGLAGPFGHFLDRTGATEVLDLCAGSGEPARILASELRRAGARPPRFVLTDLVPRPEPWIRARAADPEAIDFHAESVDATAIPASLSKGRARLVVNSLHHLPADVVHGVLRDAVAGGVGIFVSEAFPRDPLRFLPFAPWAIPAGLASSLLAHERRFAKALWTPALFAAGTWDGFVSTMRVHTEDEIREMVAPLGTFEWEFGTFPWKPFGLGTWFCGYPRP